jgi:hypothetical protein
VLLFENISKISGIIHAVSSNNGGIKRRVNSSSSSSNNNPHLIIPPRRVQAFQDQIKDGENIIKMVGCSEWTVILNENYSVRVGWQNGAKNQKDRSKESNWVVVWVILHAKHRENR